MESASKQQQHAPLELWLKDIQSYLYRTTSPIMRHAGFSFHREDYAYRRKSKKSTEELSIIFLSRFPVDYRVSFLLEIRHPQIRQIKADFMGEIVQKESNLASILLSLKDFPSRDPQQETIKDYIIHNDRDLFMAGDWLTQTLQYDLIPLCGQFSSIAHMDSFFEAKPEWSLDTHGGGNICTDLIVARLNGRRDFEQRYVQLMEGLQQRIRQQLISPESRHLLTLCYEALR
jgi:hypothetical protein